MRKTYKEKEKEIIKYLKSIQKELNADKETDLKILLIPDFERLKEYSFTPDGVKHYPCYWSGHGENESRFMFNIRNLIRHPKKNKHKLIIDLMKWEIFRLKTHYTKAICGLN